MSFPAHLDYTEQEIEDFQYSSPSFLLRKYAKTGSVELVSYILSRFKKVKQYDSYKLARAFLLTGEKEYLERASDELFVHCALAKGITRDDFVVKDVTPYITSDREGVRYTLLTAEVYENENYLKAFVEDFALTIRVPLPNTKLEEYGIPERFRPYRQILQGKYSWRGDDDLVALILLKLEKKGKLTLNSKQTDFVLSVLSKSISRGTIEWCVKHGKYIEVLEDCQSETYVIAALRCEKFHLLKEIEIDIAYSLVLDLCAVNYRVYRYLQERGYSIDRSDLIDAALDAKNDNLVALLKL